MSSRRLAARASWMACANMPFQLCSSAVASDPRSAAGALARARARVTRSLCASSSQRPPVSAPATSR
eukprot:9437708-Pyramimonas_sp.AAC.1